MTLGQGTRLNVHSLSQPQSGPRLSGKSYTRSMMTLGQGTRLNVHSLSQPQSGPGLISQGSPTLGP